VCCPIRYSTKKIKIAFLFCFVFGLHYLWLSPKVGCASGMKTKNPIFVLHSARLSLPLAVVEGRMRLGNENKKSYFCFAFRSAFTTFARKNMI
jgi:hypothetical protein